MRRYQDISRFRAPYKGMYVAGFGTETGTSQGTPATETAVVTLPEYMEQDSQGFVYYKDAKTAVIFEMLKSWMGIWTADANAPNRIVVTPMTDAQKAAASDPSIASYTAAAYVARWWNEGKVVFASKTLVEGGQGEIQIVAVPADDTMTLAAIAASTAKYAAPIMRPMAGYGAKKAGIGTFGIIAIAAAVLGVGYFVYQGTKKHGRR
jgi:hypothetical protein